MEDREALLAEIQALKLHNQAIARELRVTRAKDQQLTRTMDKLYKRVSSNAIQLQKPSDREGFDGISFIIAAYNIPDQLRRTLTTLTPHYQNCRPDQIEIIVIDNGSTEPIARDQYSEFPRLTKVIRVEGHPSPVHGLNLGIKEAQFSHVALMIDGAHMLSPGVVSGASQAVCSMPQPVINVPQYILGRVSQNLANPDGAFQKEARDLAELGWPADGYTLFDYALLAGESPMKIYYHAIESNCLITSKHVLEKFGAFNESFDEPGAGLANIEIFERLIHEPENQYVVLAGEGSFHQNHGGTTTGISSEERERVVREYYDKFEQITGRPRNFTLRAPFLVGELSTANFSVPTISHDYGAARNQIIKQLSDIYVARAAQGVDGPTPSLTLRPVSATERTIRPRLAPLGINEGKDMKAWGYRSFLRRAHRIVQPRRYLEIGVDTGGSLGLARCPSIGIDPTYEVTNQLVAPARLFKEESDAFFSNTDRLRALQTHEVDLAFIDGMHLAEYVLRDFINVESSCAKGCSVFIDDVYPEQFEMAQRDRAFNAWCGDVYKIVPILMKYRPDLNVSVFEAFAEPYRKGLALITGLDPDNTVLAENLDKIEREIKDGVYDIQSIEELSARLPVADVFDYEEILGAAVAEARAAAGRAG